MKRVGWAIVGVALVALVYGCGGSSTRKPDLDMSALDDAGAGGRPEAAAGMGGMPGMPTSDLGGVAGLGEAGQGVAMQPPLIRSATRYCESSLECFGLACVAPPSQPAVCVMPCASDGDCEPDEACLGGGSLEKSCFRRCDSPRDCDYRFDCFDFDEASGLVCFPGPWTIGWR
jgi:hypothetical protein